MQPYTEEQINNMTPEEYQEFLDTVDPDVMGNEEGAEGMKENAD